MKDEARFSTGVTSDRRAIRAVGYAVGALLLIAAALAFSSGGDSRASEIPTHDARRAVELANRWRDGEPDVDTYSESPTCLTNLKLS